MNRQRPTEKDPETDGSDDLWTLVECSAEETT